MSLGPLMGLGTASALGGQQQHHHQHDPLSPFHAQADVAASASQLAVLSGLLAPSPDLPPVSAAHLGTPHGWPASLAASGSGGSSSSPLGGGAPLLSLPTPGASPSQLSAVLSNLTALQRVQAMPPHMPAQHQLADLQQLHALLLFQQQQQQQQQHPHLQQQQGVGLGLCGASAPPALGPHAAAAAGLSMAGSPLRSAHYGGMPAATPPPLPPSAPLSPQLLSPLGSHAHLLFDPVLGGGASDPGSFMNHPALLHLQLLGRQAT